MKKINRLFTAMLFIVVSVFSLTSCEEEEFFYDGESFINFKTTTLSAVENRATILSVPVFLSTTLHPGNVTTEIEFGGGAKEGVDYTIVEGKTLNFPAGVYSDTVKIQVIDNEKVDGNRDIVLTLKSNSAGFNLGYPGPEKTNSSVNVTIIDNDCPLDASKFTGNFAAKYTDTSDNSVYNDQSTITPDANDPTTFVISNFWGEALPAKIKFDVCAGEVSIPSQQFSSNFYNYGPATLKSVAPVGTFSETNGKITVTFNIRVSAGSFGVHKAEFTKL